MDFGDDVELREVLSFAAKTRVSSSFETVVKAKQRRTMGTTNTVLLVVQLCLVVFRALLVVLPARFRRTPLRTNF